MAGATTRQAHCQEPQVIAYVVEGAGAFVHLLPSRTAQRVDVHLAHAHYFASLAAVVQGVLSDLFSFPLDLTPSLAESGMTQRLAIWPTYGFSHT